MTARILQFARRTPAVSPTAVEASGSETGPTTHGSPPSAPSFLAGASIVHDGRRERVEHIVRPRGMGGVFRKPFGCGVWIFAPDDPAMPRTAVTVPETLEALNSLLRSRVNHPSNQTTKGTQ